jgi:hypothetical protein
MVVSPSSPNSSPEPVKDHILPTKLGVVPAQRSRVGMVLVVVIAIFTVGGIATAGFLAVQKIHQYKPVVATTSTTNKPLSYVDLNQDGKIVNNVDPYAQNAPAIVNNTLRETADFGDAPEETSVIGQVDYTLFGSFPTALDDSLAGVVRHMEKEASFFLGMRKFGDGVTLEPDAETVNLDEHDDGIIMPLFVPCELASIQVEVSVPKELKPPYFLNALADWNRDSTWGGSSVCKRTGDAIEVNEWFIANLNLQELFDLSPGESRRLIIPDFLVGPQSGPTWFRFTLTTEPVVADPSRAGWDGSGLFSRGETEDYLVEVFSNSESAENSQNDLLKVTQNTDTRSDALDELLPTFQDLLDEPTFADVKNDDWFAEYATYVVKRGFMKSNAESMFRPDGFVSRGEVVTVALRMNDQALEGEPIDTDDDGLSDIEETLLGTDKNSLDTDGDGLNDYREVMSGTDPKSLDTRIGNLPFPLDTIRLRHWSRGNVVRAIVMSLISASDFPAGNFGADEPATKGFALDVLLRAAKVFDPERSSAEVAQELKLIQNSSTFDAEQEINRAAMAKFTTELHRRVRTSE